MRHPFERLTPGAFRALYAVAWLGTIGVGAVLQHYGLIYSAQTGPNGETYDVIAFEFAATPERMQAVFDTWGDEGMRAARVQTVVDCAFPFFYASLIAAGIVALYGAGMSPGWTKAGRLLAWGQFKAAGLDLVENAALLGALYGGAVSPFPQIAAGAAAVKFILIGLGVAYIFAALPFLPRGASVGR